MKQRVADYIADFLAEHNINDIFTVTGGGAMHMNDAFGHHPKLHCYYNHHEQASAMAAEAYARIDNRIAAVCVTTGPGATNAITGVVCGWMDSIPMLVFSGQARYATTVYASGLKLRTRGVQEFDIVGSVKNMTKYCELIEKPEKIAYCLEKALYLAKHGRPGPCWLDIPMDIQGALIETVLLEHYNALQEQKNVSDSVIELILDRICKAKRPVIFAGNGIRLAGAHEAFLTLVGKLNIPVVTGMSSIDAIASDHPLYAGRNGTTGDRAGNFAIQNSDLLLSLGSRLSFFQTGFNYDTWARNAYKIVNDIDLEELEKDSIHADLKICCDVLELINKLNEKVAEPIKGKEDWIRQCQIWRKRYPVVLQKHMDDLKPNIYAVYKTLTQKMSDSDCLLVSAGTSRVAGSQASEIKEGMRFITNPSTASMGYDLPPAIGVCIARGKKKTIVCTGDGGFQMNIQELQTIVQNRLPIAVIIMNNQGYHSIRMTQNTYFGKPLVGIGPESGDLSFPDLSKLIPAYGMDYMRCGASAEVEKAIDWILKNDKPCLCEMLLSPSQVTEPKAASKKLSNGQMKSAPLEDMAPFLSDEELKSNMYIPLIEG
ncbi:thiamine pyrophosphate-binding protein [Blautia schinkii]|nr:thiamine pyrophosphate-binding protein [Blautia schinkii]